MDYGLLPPEINSNRMFRGPGSESLLAAAAAWEALAEALFSAEISVLSTISGLGNDFWQGPSASLMADAVRPYLRWIALTAARAHRTAAQARSAAAAYGIALRQTVLPMQIIANRKRLRSLTAANHLAQHTPTIAAVEARYSEMWAQDAAAMYAYARNAAAATELDPFPVPDVELIGVGPGEPGDTLALRRIKTDAQLYRAVPCALESLASPTSPSRGTPQPTPDSGADPDSDNAGLTSPMSAVWALISRLAGADSDRSDTVGRTRGRPVPVRAWFSGCRVPPRSRLSTYSGRRAAPGEQPDLKPAATVGELSVPQAWVEKAPPRPAPTVPPLASRFTSSSDRKP